MGSLSGRDDELSAHFWARPAGDIAILNLKAVEDEPVDWRFRVIGKAAPTLTVGSIGDQGWTLASNEVVFPALVLRRAALHHNIHSMATYCASRGVRLAPHGKTAMSPQILSLQLDAGAWGVTVANVSQARVFISFGVRQLMIANELASQRDVLRIAAELQDHEDLQITCLVDSVDSVELLDAALAQAGSSCQLSLLLEIGIPGARTGCRTDKEAMRVVRAIQGSERLRLVGIEGYEGVLGVDRNEVMISQVHSFMMRLRSLAEDLVTAGAFDQAQEIVVSAGGSVFFDQAAEVLASGWDVPVTTVVRSGCYVTHDCGYYDRGSPLRGTLVPALELWANVISQPEPELAVCNFGKRDAPYDVQLPTPLRVVRSSGEPGSVQHLSVRKLYDQHAILTGSGASDLMVGDSVVFGISHPCAAFEKHPLVLEVDAGNNVVGGVRTYF